MVRRPVATGRARQRGTLTQAHQCVCWLGLVCSLLGACLPPESERLSCRDTLPAAQSSFNGLTALVFDPLKGCTASGCHSGDTQQEGLRLDEPALVYEEFATRPDEIYATLASGQMPEDG